MEHIRACKEFCAEWEVLVALAPCAPSRWRQMAVHHQPKAAVPVEHRARLADQR